MLKRQYTPCGLCACCELSGCSKSPRPCGPSSRPLLPRSGQFVIRCSFWRSSLRFMLSWLLAFLERRIRNTSVASPLHSSVSQQLSHPSPCLPPPSLLSLSLTRLPTHSVALSLPHSLMLSLNRSLDHSRARSVSLNLSLALTRTRTQTRTRIHSHVSGMHRGWMVQYRCKNHVS